VRSQGARDRRALTGEAGNASCRKVIVGATARSPEWASAWRTQDESGPTFSRVMRTNFGGTTAKIFREHSDSLEPYLSRNEALREAGAVVKKHWRHKQEALCLAIVNVIEH
jgi:hypothetical protein